MQEFLLNNYLFITYLVEIIAAVIGLLFYRKYKNTVARYFIWFLVYISCMEIIQSYPVWLTKYAIFSPVSQIIQGTKFETNYWLSTIYWSLGSVIFYSFYFRKIIKSHSYVRLIRYSTLLFVVSSILYISLNWDAYFKSVITFIEIFGLSIILLCIVLYFVEVLKSENVLMFYKSLSFYIGAVVFIWILITTPLMFYDVYFSRQDMDYVMLKAIVFLSSNIFMYLTFAFALIFCKTEEKSLLDKRQ